MGTITVVNKHHGLPGVNIMRPTPLGNPFSHMAGTAAQWHRPTREEAVEAYREWLKARLREQGPAWRMFMDLLDQARAGDLALRCCCAPRSCHGDVLRAALEYFLEHERRTGRLPRLGPPRAAGPNAATR